MTKARDLANIISGGFTASDIPNLDASKITSGSIADARIPASAVSQHATTYDDNKLQSNIALLGFKTAVNGSLAKYNLQDQIIDEYINESGIDTGASTNEIFSSGFYSGSGGGALSGGTLTSYSGYSARTFLADGNLVVTGTGTVDILLVGGGGQGGHDGEGDAGGGGAGGFRVITSHSLAAGTHAIQVGDGGAASTSQNSGQASIALTYTANGGGSGGTQASLVGVAGASGGGGGGESNPTAGAGNTPSTSPSQGNNGGTGDTTSGSGRSGGGGGGATAVGVNASSGQGGDGGAGTANTYRTGSGVTYAGGGAGGSKTTGGTGGAGGGGDGADTVATNMTGGSANTGGGGGGGANGSAGGTGIVVVRFATGQFGGAAYNDLTLQSLDTTASTANPDFADMVCLIEDNEGTATLNTDIKGYISEDSGSTFTQGTLVDEGTWGTNKKIIAFHDLDISAQTGSAMCYKITTHNQSASKDTRVHATSIGWR